MANTTPGKAFYDRQASFLAANNVTGLIASQYAPAEELVGYELRVKGTQALLKHFIGYLANLGSIKLISTDKFKETEDAVMFEASMKVTAGVEGIYDSFVLKDGKAVYHFTGMLGFTPNS